MDNGRHILRGTASATSSNTPSGIVVIKSTSFVARRFATVPPALNGRGESSKMVLGTTLTLRGVEGSPVRFGTDSSVLPELEFAVGSDGDEGCSWTFPLDPSISPL